MTAKSIPLPIELRWDELEYLSKDSRCKTCNHLSVFHFDDMGVQACVIAECACEDREPAKLSKENK